MWLLREDDRDFVSCSDNSGMKPGTPGQGLKIYTGGSHVLTHVPGSTKEPCGGDLCEKFGVDQVNLTEVWWGGIAAQRQHDGEQCLRHKAHSFQLLSSIAVIE